VPPRRYIDFKIHLVRAVDGTVRVAVLPTAEVGESSTPATVAVDRLPSLPALTKLANKTATLRELVAIGKQLGDALLPDGEVRALFTAAMKLAATDGGVRLRLVIADHELQTWPWEYAYVAMRDGPDGMHGFLALDPRVSFTRHQPLPSPHPNETMTSSSRSLRMLVAAALPADQDPLDLNREIDNVTSAVAGIAIQDARIELAPVLRDATGAALDAALRSPGDVQIFHFAGHAVMDSHADPFTRGVVRDAGFVLLVDDPVTRATRALSAPDLGRLLLRAGVRLAVLSACNTGQRSETHPWDSVAGALVASGIAAVVAMQSTVLDEPAAEFARAFYGALASGLSLDEAMSAGRLAMLWTSDIESGDAADAEWGVLVLYSRLPNGTLFPERMAKAGAEAEAYRTVIRQVVGTIETGGTVTGLRARVVNGSLLVEQKVTTVARGASLGGLVAGRVGDSARIAVKQDADTVAGDMTGATVDEV
jgi:hypothetical protein